MIDRKHYPGLDGILWDWHGDIISDEFAHSVYGRRWRYVSEKHLTDRERELINRLVEKFGRLLK